MFKKKNKKVLKTATNDDMAYARSIVDEVYYPILKQHIKTLNKTLEKRNIRAGIEIRWFFDRFEEGDE